jgi:glycosyltransferase involved in cell wall biosynthesis
MATYNGERFLQEQLDSIARQTLLPHELVVCDDGSTDGTLDILHRFAAQAPFPVRIHQNEARLGFGFNFLGALGRCTGDLVAFSDQDDIWKEEKLRVCAEAMRDPTVGMVSHSARVLAMGPSPLQIRLPDHPDRWIENCSQLPVHRAIVGFSIVLRRVVLERSPVPVYDRLRAAWAAHDRWAVAAALAYGRIKLLADELALYRLHESNVSLRQPAVGAARFAPASLTFERGHEINTGTAGFIRYAASFCDARAATIFLEYAEELERVGYLYLDRAYLHRTCGQRIRALRAFATMIAKGDYSPRGFGLKGFLRDAFLVALWRA